ncbi:MAG TPA: GIY-YIG nuclease family protein [Bacteroidia bacterium]|nr:GIY-YIG nuclease family protein [Bacteroidia bacterium]
MMFTYAIKSDVDGRIYVGMTSDITKRFGEHNSGKTKSTKGYVPWKLIYTKAHLTRLDARRHEKYLKGGSGKEFLKSIIP